MVQQSRSEHVRDSNVGVLVGPRQQEYSSTLAQGVDKGIQLVWVC